MGVRGRSGAWCAALIAGSAAGCTDGDGSAAIPFEPGASSGTPPPGCPGPDCVETFGADGSDATTGPGSTDAGSDTSGSGDNSAGSSGGTQGGSDPLEVCYAGATTLDHPCFPLVEIDAYEYPDPIGANYTPPVRYLDVEALDLTVPLAPNFLFSEFSDPAAGKYQVVQPHAVERVQQVRDAAGPLLVGSGFRSPPYNASVPDADPASRHLFGDGFDFIPLDPGTTQQELIDICGSVGAGYTAIYDDGHVHCDWRNIPNDPLFYDAEAALDLGPAFGAADLAAQVVPEGNWLRVDAWGFDAGEGQLSRRWTAYARDGSVLATADGLEFEPPPGTAVVEVDVGGLRTLSYGDL